MPQGGPPKTRWGFHSPVVTPIYPTGWGMFPKSDGFLMTDEAHSAYARGISLV